MGTGDVMGVDPGLAETGYAVLSFGRSGAGGAGPRGGLGPRDSASPHLVEAGLVRTHAREPLPRRLQEVYHGLLEVLQQHRPDHVVVEDLYTSYRHPRTAILMGHARGVVLLAAAHTGSAVVSFAPSRIKQALTGRGNASKEQVQRMVQSYLGLRSLPEPDHVADAMALAVAFGHFQDAARAAVPGGKWR